MQQFKIAVFIDVDNVKLKKESFDELLFKLQKYGKIVFCQLYNFSDKKNNDLTKIINTNGYTTSVMTPANKKSKRNFFDIRIAIDATKLSLRNQSVDAYCIYCGQAKGDITPLISSLKADGKYVIEALSIRGESLSPIFDEQLTIFSSDEIKIKPQITAAKTVKKVKKNEKANIVSSDETEANITQNNKLAKLSKAEIIKLAKEQIEEESKKLMSDEKQKIEKELQEYKTAELSKISQQKQKLEDQVKIEMEKGKKLAKKREAEEAEEIIEDKKRDIADTYIKKFKETKTLNEKLEDFATRTSNLNFDYNKDVDQKLELLFDIEECLAEETANGRGKNSKDERERNAFSEIEALILNLKEAILESMDKELVNETNYANLHSENTNQDTTDIEDENLSENNDLENTEIKQNTQNQNSNESEAKSSGKYYYENPIITETDDDYEF